MLLPILILIIILSGIIGGYISYILPANADGDGKPIRSIMKSVCLGIGAAVLVPLFLEIAQSKLLDNIQVRFKSKIENCNCNSGPGDTASLNIAAITDSTRTVRDTLKVDSNKTKLVISKKMNAKEASNCCVPLKSYFLFAAYCLLAAAAGLRFITSLIDSVIKEKQIVEAQKGKAKAEEEKEKVQEEKEKIEKENEKRVKNSQISQKIEEENLRNELAREEISIFQSRKGITKDEKINIPILPVLSPIIHPDDPQKGRFGGRSENNERKLSAEVAKSAIPGFYDVTLIVESTNPDNPLNSEVIFYIHDSFSPSVFTYKPNEFTDDKAIEDEIISYGAFTVGVITDNGKTMLELDLSEDAKFPKEFRER